MTPALASRRTEPRDAECTCGPEQNTPVAGCQGSLPHPQQLNIAIISGLETPFKVRQFTSSLPGALLPRRPVNPAAQYGGISGYKLAVRSLIVFSIIVSLVVCKQ